MITKIKISPEQIKSIINSVDYSGNSVGVYSGMSHILSGSTGNTSLLTGLTINVMLTQEIKDLGYYTPFDGNINQKDTIANFLVVSDVDEPYTYYLYNTSQIENKFSDTSTYQVDWGDGSAKQNITGLVLSHDYPIAEKQYTITLYQNNNFGNNIVSKRVTVPYVIPDIDTSDPDSENNVANQVSNVSLLISGYTKSRLSELYLYGQNEYRTGVPVIKYGNIFGVIDDIGSSFTGYTIQGIKYFDYPENVTVYISPSSGVTSDMISASAITKEEYLLHVVSQPEIQTNVFVERGKNSAYEKVQRIGEIDNISDMENYGRGFFNLVNKP